MVSIPGLCTQTVVTYRMCVCVFKEIPGRLLRTVFELRPVYDPAATMCLSFVYFCICHFPQPMYTGIEMKYFRVGT